METLDVFIGYDPREAIAFHVCANSIIRHSSVPVSIHPLALSNLRGEYKETHDVKSGKTGYEPTNQFIFSRFLVPHLMGYKGMAVFMDGDMIVRSDIADLFKLHTWGKALSVVQHDYKTKYPVKYLNQKNGDYERKNWSSVILFDCAHFGNRMITPEFVQNATGEFLHRFKWLDKDEIGSLPIEWNWLPEEYGENPQAKLIHWTIGTPCFQDYATSPMASEWHKERVLTNHSNQIGID